MNVYILYYDGFWALEPIPVLNRLSDERIVAIALEARPYTCYEKVRFVPDLTVAEVDPDQVDMLIVAGGDGRSIMDSDVVGDFIRELHRRGKLIAGICFGSILLANYGVLDGKRCTGAGQGITDDAPWRPCYRDAVIVNDRVVRDGNLITAMGIATEEFAAELARVRDEFNAKQEPSGS
ncbi:MAG: DJ-1/PfpI family protein [Bacillota bacterium]